MDTARMVLLPDDNVMDALIAHVLTSTACACAGLTRGAQAPEAQEVWQGWLQDAEGQDAPAAVSRARAPGEDARLTLSASDGAVHLAAEF